MRARGFHDIDEQCSEPRHLNVVVETNISLDNIRECYYIWWESRAGLQTVVLDAGSGGIPVNRCTNRGKHGDISGSHSKFFLLSPGPLLEAGLFFGL
jgi:hypothetical protein